MNSTSGNADIGLTREKSGTWTSNGTASGSSSGNTDWSDTTKLVTAESLFGGTVTTTAETDTGRHYEYDMSTTRKLRNNTWSAYAGSGTGKGNGWDYLTITKEGSYSYDTQAGVGLDFEPYTNVPPNLTYTINGKVDGLLSDKLNYKYDDKFALASAGWTTTTIGEGTRKITDDYSWTHKGSTKQSGSAQDVRIENWDPGTGNLEFTLSVNIDNGNVRHEKTDIVFDWTNGNSSVTQQTKKSVHIYEHSDGSLDAVVRTSSGNIGSEASNGSGLFDWKIK